MFLSISIQISFSDLAAEDRVWTHQTLALQEAHDYSQTRSYTTSDAKVRGPFDQSVISLRSIPLRQNASGACIFSAAELEPTATFKNVFIDVDVNIDAANCVSLWISVFGENQGTISNVSMAGTVTVTNFPATKKYSNFVGFGAKCADCKSSLTFNGQSSQSYFDYPDVLSTVIVPPALTEWTFPTFKAKTLEPDEISADVLLRARHLKVVEMMKYFSQADTYEYNGVLTASKEQQVAALTVAAPAFTLTVCKPGQFYDLTGGSCIAACAAYTYLRTCAAVCPNGKVISGKQCSDVCPPSTEPAENGVCNICTMSLGFQCISAANSSIVLYNSEYYLGCPYEMVWTSTGCVAPTCTAPLYQEITSSLNLYCGATCKPGLDLNTAKTQCIATCPGGQYDDNFACTTACSPNKYLRTATCSDSCGNGQYGSYDTCATSCSAWSLGVAEFHACPICWKMPYLKRSSVTCTDKCDYVTPVVKTIAGGTKVTTIVCESEYQFCVFFDNAKHYLDIPTNPFVCQNDCQGFIPGAQIVVDPFMPLRCDLTCTTFLLDDVDFTKQVNDVINVKFGLPVLTSNIWRCVDSCPTNWFYELKFVTVNGVDYAAKVCRVDCPPASYVNGLDQYSTTNKRCAADCNVFATNKVEDSRTCGTQCVILPFSQEQWKTVQSVPTKFMNCTKDCKVSNATRRFLQTSTKACMDKCPNTFVYSTSKFAICDEATCAATVNILADDGTTGISVTCAATCTQFQVSTIVVAPATSVKFCLPITACNDYTKDARCTSIQDGFCPNTFQFTETAPKQCVANCADISGYPLPDNTCTLVCQNYLTGATGKEVCQATCGTNERFYQVVGAAKYCKTTCTSGFFKFVAGVPYFQCIDTCTTTFYVDTNLNNLKRCTLTCTELEPIYSLVLYTATTLQCTTSCKLLSQFQITIGKTCVVGCPMKIKADTTDNICINECPNFVLPSLYCTDTCTEFVPLVEQTFKNYLCRPCGTQLKKYSDAKKASECVDSCGNWYKKIGELVCIQSCDTPQFMDNASWTCTLTCADFVHNRFCQPTCSQLNYTLQNTQRFCADTCPFYVVGHKNLFSCAPDCATLSPTYRVSFNQLCQATCKEKMLTQVENTAFCSATCANYVNQLPADDYCVASCLALSSMKVIEQDRKYCTADCGAALPDLRAIAGENVCKKCADVDYITVDTNSQTWCIDSCPVFNFYNSVTRKCVDKCEVYTFNPTGDAKLRLCQFKCNMSMVEENSNLTCRNPCPQWYHAEIAKLLPATTPYQCIKDPNVAAIAAGTVSGIVIGAGALVAAYWLYRTGRCKLLDKGRQKMASTEVAQTKGLKMPTKPGVRDAGQSNKPLKLNKKEEGETVVPKYI